MNRDEFWMVSYLLMLHKTGDPIKAAEVANEAQYQYDEVIYDGKLPVGDED